MHTPKKGLAATVTAGGWWRSYREGGVEVWGGAQKNMKMLPKMHDIPVSSSLCRLFKYFWRQVYMRCVDKFFEKLPSQLSLLQEHQQQSFESLLIAETFVNYK